MFNAQPTGEVMSRRTLSSQEATTTAGEKDDASLMSCSQEYVETLASGNEGLREFGLNGTVTRAVSRAPCVVVATGVCWLFNVLTSQLHASVSQGRIC